MVPKLYGFATKPYSCQWFAKNRSFGTIFPKKFEKGDVMVMISDGLPELPNHENELLDYPVIQDCIKEHVNKSADDIKNALIELSDQWANGLMNPDDITIVVIKKVT